MASVYFSGQVSYQLSAQDTDAALFTLLQKRYVEEKRYVIANVSLTDTIVGHSNHRVSVSRTGSFYAVYFVDM